MDFRQWLSGRRRGAGAVLLRAGLCGLSLPYRAVVVARQFAYDNGWANVQRVEASVISIGNLTVGGTGKTPLVRYVARLLGQQGLSVALLSRGYGAAQGADNDEALELAATLPGVPHLQQADRSAAARLAVQQHGAQVLLLDDGFQHRRLHRDLDIVVVDATCPWGYGHLLPRGLLREPIGALRRAGVIVLSRCDAVDANQRQAIVRRALAANPNLVVVHSVHRPRCLLSWPTQTTPLASLAGVPVAVLSAIGNPAAFADTVRRCGARVVDSLALPDHAQYDAAIMQQVTRWLDSLHPAAEVVCTHKDLVKIRTARIGGRPVRALLVEIELHSGQELFDELVLATAGGQGRPGTSETTVAELS